MDCHQDREQRAWHGRFLWGSHALGAAALQCLFQLAQNEALKGQLVVFESLFYSVPDSSAKNCGHFLNRHKHQVVVFKASIDLKRLWIPRRTDLPLPNRHSLSCCFHKAQIRIVPSVPVRKSRFSRTGTPYPTVLERELDFVPSWTAFYPLYIYTRERALTHPPGSPEGKLSHARAQGVEITSTLGTKSITTFKYNHLGCAEFCDWRRIEQAHSAQNFYVVVL
jgi:hypothetical protein